MGREILVPALTARTALLVVFLGAYLQGFRNRREQIAKALPEFYAAARAAYYAWEDFNKVHDKAASPNYQYLHKLQEVRYRELMAALTALAALMPPRFQKRLEEFQKRDWTDKGDPTPENEAEFIKHLNRIRKDVFDLNHRWLFDPAWRR